MRVCAGRGQLEWETGLTGGKMAGGRLLRSFAGLFHCPRDRPPLDAPTETWPSGRRRSPAKGVWVKSPSRVRIPSSPPSLFCGATARHAARCLSTAERSSAFVGSSLWWPASRLVLSLAYPSPSGEGAPEGRVRGDNATSISARSDDTPQPQGHDFPSSAAIRRHLLPKEKGRLVEG